MDAPHSLRRPFRLENTLAGCPSHVLFSSLVSTLSSLFSFQSRPQVISLCLLSQRLGTIQIVSGSNLLFLLHTDPEHEFVGPIRFASVIVSQLFRRMLIIGVVTSSPLSFLFDLTDFLDTSSGVPLDEVIYGNSDFVNCSVISFSVSQAFNAAAQEQVICYILCLY